MSIQNILNYLHLMPLIDLSSKAVDVEIRRPQHLVRITPRTQ